MQRIVVDERTIRWGNVKLLEPRRTDREMREWWQWVGYVREIPCADYEPVQVNTGGRHE